MSEYAVIFSPGFVKNTFAYSALFVCSNSSHGLELLMEPASVSRPLSMIHSLSPSVRRPLFLPSSSPPLLFSSTLLFLSDGWIKLLTASNGHIQHTSPHKPSCSYVIPLKYSISYCVKVTCGAERKPFTTFDL